MAAVEYSMVAMMEVQAVTAEEAATAQKVEEDRME
jgi:hypothetical protein